MSRPQDPHRAFFPFGNPFRMILPKGSYLSPRLLELLSTFEETLAGRLRKLKPNDKEEVLSLSWMRFAMESLGETHTDIKALITALELPVCDWDEKWIDVYLDDSVRLLDSCIAFTSEISRVSQGHLLLRCALHILDCSPSKQFDRACSSLDSWRQHITAKNPRLQNCFNILDSLAATLHPPKVKNSAKGKVLMQAMYGVKVATLFVCGIFAAAFSGSVKKLVDLKVPEYCLWAEAFTDLQAFVHGEMRNLVSNGRVTTLKELEGVDAGVKKLYPMIQDRVETFEAETLNNSISDLGKKAEKFSEGLDILAKGVDAFFQIVLSGRDALLCNLREGNNISNPPTTQEKNNVGEQVVR